MTLVAMLYQNRADLLLKELYSFLGWLLVICPDYG